MSGVGPGLLFGIVAFLASLCGGFPRWISLRRRAFSPLLSPLLSTDLPFSRRTVYAEGKNLNLIARWYLSKSLLKLKLNQKDSKV